MAARLNDAERVGRDAAVRHGRALPLEALQRRVDAREPDARSRQGHAERPRCRKADGSPGIVSTTPGATVRQALRLMALHDVSQLPVMDGPVCVGSVTESALAAQALEQPKVLDGSVSDTMVLSQQ